MEVIILTIAFVLGFGAGRIGFPPLIGYLLAGFLLNAFGVERHEEIAEHLSDIGILLLLFTIGLKLQLKSLIRPIVYGTAIIHLLVTIALFSGIFYALNSLEIPGFTDLGLVPILLISFALSFSSTIFAFKVLEGKGGLISLYGRTSIGILVIQDLVAVLFLTISVGKIPSIWALGLLLLPLARPLLLKILEHVGHGELKILFGIVMALLGAFLFEIVGMKPDLGALVMGQILVGHPKSDELAKGLMGFKDIFLIAFFVNIGYQGNLNAFMLYTGFAISLLVLIKGGLFHMIFTRLNMRARTSFITSSILANFSEFGLIVGAMAVKSGWMEGEWLGILALALAFSFVWASPLNARSYSIYARFEKFLVAFQTPKMLPDDQPLDTGDAHILIFGMGRVGSSAYDFMSKHFGKEVLGIDADPKVVEENLEKGRKVILGDATDTDFWEKLQPNKVRLVMLTMTKHAANYYAARQFRNSQYDCAITATAQYADEKEELEELGIDSVFNIFKEAGVGFAEDTLKTFKDEIPDLEEKG